MTSRLHRSSHVVVSLLMSGLVLLGQFSSVAHLLLVRHVTCAEHGELIHSSDEVVAPIAAASTGLEVGSVPGRIDAHGHDHCLSWTPRREDSLALQAGVNVLPVVHQVVSPIERWVSPPSGVALLRLAPKSSPPV